MKPIPPTAAPQRRHKLFPELLRLAFPIAISLLSYSVMTLIDTLFVGRLGANSLAAVGLGGNTVFLVGCFGYGTLAGAKLRVAQAQGRGQTDPVQLLSGLGLIALCIAPLTYLATLSAATLLPQITAEPLTGQLAQDYASVRALSAFPYLAGGAIAQYRVALGDSKTPMRAAVVAALCNAPLNALFLWVLDCGVVGVAWATVSARLIETGALFLSLNAKQRHAFCKPLGASITRGADLRSLLGYGIAVGLERWLDTASFTLVVFLLAQLGAIAVAAHQIVLQIVHFCFLPLAALSEGLSVLLAQASAKQPHHGKTEHMRSIVRQGLWYTLAFGTTSAAFVATFRAPLVALFTSEAGLATAAQDTVLAAAGLLLLFQIFMLLKGALRGTGRVRLVAVVSVSCAWLATPPLTWLFGIQWGLGTTGAWLALCAEVMAANVVLLICARQEVWFPHVTVRPHRFRLSRR